MKDEHPLDGSAPRIAEGVGVVNGNGNGHADVEKEQTARDSGQAVLAGLKTATGSPEARKNATAGEATPGNGEPMNKPSGNAQTGK
jgi:hypothetical protein